MTCMTTKKKFDVDEPEVIVLRNGRYAFRAECPWEGKNGKRLVAFKFCSALDYQKSIATPEGAESEHSGAESEHSDAESKQIAAAA